MPSIIEEDIGISFISTNEAPLDKRTLYQTVKEFLSAPENAYAETSNPITGTTEIDTNRFIGQKVMIQNPPGGGSPCEYWFKDGITDADLVKYTSESNDSYKWKKIKPNGSNISGGSGGGINFDDPLRVMRGDGTLSEGYIEFRNTLDGVFQDLPLIAHAAGYIVQWSASKLEVCLLAFKNCGSFGVYINNAYRDSADSNFTTSIEWKKLAFDEHTLPLRSAPSTGTYTLKSINGNFTWVAG
jgi:hypothetical protein